MGSQLSTAQLAAIEQLAKEISQADGSSFDISATDEAKAPIRKKALRLLDQRSRSRDELRQRLLASEEFSPALIEEVLDSLASARLIDDQQFANEWVRQRAAYRKKSKSVLNRELKEKGVCSEFRREALAQISESDEAAMARKLAHKKAKTIKAVPVDYISKQKDLRKVVGVLARRGFGQGMSTSIARAELEQRYAELANE